MSGSGRLGGLDVLAPESRACPVPPIRLAESVAGDDKLAPAERNGPSV